MKKMRDIDRLRRGDCVLMELGSDLIFQSDGDFLRLREVALIEEELGRCEWVEMSLRALKRDLNFELSGRWFTETNGIHIDRIGTD